MRLRTIGIGAGGLSHVDSHSANDDRVGLRSPRAARSGDLQVGAAAQPRRGHSVLVHSNDLRRTGLPQQLVGYVLGIRGMRIMA
jgi:hypothetical protein